MHPSEVQWTEILVIAVVNNCAINVKQIINLAIQLRFEPIRIEVQLS